MGVGLHLSETTGRREQRLKGLGLVVKCCSVLYDLGGVTTFRGDPPLSLVYLEGEGPSVPGVITPHVNA